MNNWQLSNSQRKSSHQNNHRRGSYGGPWLLTLMLVPVALGMSGCGTDFDTILLRSAETTGRTFLDIFLTDLANTLAQQAANEPDDTGDDDGDVNNQPDNGSSDGNVGGGSLDDLVGDFVKGQTIFAANGCGGCHCDDASGGCALSAPPIAGVLIDLLDDKTRGSANHPIKVDITNQDLADLQAYLASL